MLKNYLKISLRNIQRQKPYALINIFGLALGVACCLLILLFVEHERSFNKFHTKANRLFHDQKRFAELRVSHSYELVEEAGS